MEDLKEKLKTEVEKADWDMLRIHHQREAVVLISGKLSLLDVAVAVAMDKAEFIKIWLDNGDIGRPSKVQIDDFEIKPFEKNYEFIIIQPYVLVRILA